MDAPTQLRGVPAAWWRHYHPWGWLLLLLVAVTVTPEIDLRVSNLFYDPKFGFIDNAAVQFVRRHVPRLIILSTVVMVIGATRLGLLRNAPVIAQMTLRQAGFLVASLLIGPGLIIESLLKPHWGRARPDEIVAFGGTMPYTPPLWISNACTHNCSFASGHAAVTFWLTAYAFLLPPRYRRAGVMVGLLLGLAVGMVRVMQGAHFFSDVVYAGAIVLGVNALLARIMLVDRGSA